jgi:four helix bundle protein
MATKRFQELIVWQNAHQIVLPIYRYSNAFPKTEVYTLSSQFKRAATSNAANIAEGYKNKSKLDKARLFNIAQGSLEECQYYRILSNDPGYGDKNALVLLLDEVARMLERYIHKVLFSNS